MTRNWSRRDVVKLIGGGLAAAGLVPAAAATGVRTARGAENPGSVGGGAELPPRVIGLLTQGGDFRFDPVGLLIASGSAVTWLNMGDFHTTTAFHPDYGNLLPGEVPLRIPEGAEPWHSGMLGMTAGTEFEHTFEVPGVYDYFCQPHYSFGMVGRIVVDGPRGGPAVTGDDGDLNEASREALPPVETITGPAGRTFEWAARINGLLLLKAHGEDARAPAASLSEASAADAELQRVLEAAGATSSFRSGLDRLLAGIRSGTGYEELIGRAGAVKATLRSARAAAG